MFLLYNKIVESTIFMSLRATKGSNDRLDVIIKYMLEKLFGSKARVKILKLFLIHPTDKFYIRQLSRDLKLQLNSVRRELENLENFGILTSDFKSEAEDGSKQEAVGGQEKKYFRANPNFVLFDEIKKYR